MRTETRLLIRGKGGKVQHQTLYPQTKALLNRYLKLTQGLPKSAPLFSSLRSPFQGLTTRAIRLRTDSLLREAGIEEGKSCHSLRHALGSTMAAQSVPLTQIQEKLRHSDLRVSLKYISNI